MTKIEPQFREGLHECTEVSDNLQVLRDEIEAPYTYK